MKERMEMVEKEGRPGSYASVNGLNMYYEVHGAGEPLVLLHGALSDIGTSFGGMLPSLATTRKVIAVEQQGHGHTADIDRPLSVHNMAEDTVALLGLLGLRNVDVFGYSMGAGVALEIALHHPYLVRKLVLVSLAYSSDGFHPGLMEGLSKIRPQDLAGTGWQLEYAKIAPNPSDWPKLVQKNAQMGSAFPGWSSESIRMVEAPTMVMVGDSDIVRPEHAVEMFRLLGGGAAGDTAGLPRSRLAILPGTTHAAMVDRSEWVVSMVEDFLEAPMPRAK